MTNRKQLWITLLSASLGLFGATQLLGCDNGSSGGDDGSGGAGAGPGGGTGNSEPPPTTADCESEDDFTPIPEDQSCADAGFANPGETYMWVITDYQILTDQPFPFDPPPASGTETRATIGRDIDGTGTAPNRDLRPAEDGPLCRAGSNPTSRVDFYDARGNGQMNGQGAPMIDNALVNIAQELQQTLYDAIVGGGNPPPGVAPYFSNFVSHNANAEGDLYLVIKQVDYANGAGEVGCANLQIYFTDKTTQPSGEKLTTTIDDVYESFENPSVPRERIDPNQSVNVTEDQLIVDTTIRVRSCGDGAPNEALGVAENLPIKITVQGEGDSGAFGFELDLQDVELSYRYDQASVSAGLISGVLNMHGLLNSLAEVSRGNPLIEMAIGSAVETMYQFIDLNMFGREGSLGQLRNPGIRVPVRRIGANQYEWLGAPYPALTPGIIGQAIQFQPGEDGASDYAPNCHISDNGSLKPVELITEGLCERDQAIVDAALAENMGDDFNADIGGIVKFPSLITQYRGLYGGSGDEIPAEFSDEANLLCEGVTAGIGISTNAPVSAINIVDENGDPIE